MALPIEGFTVVAQLPRIQHLLESSSFEAPNASALQDEDLWRCCFMAEADALKFAKKLEAQGLNISNGPGSDVVLVSEFDRSIEPYCEWLRTATWDKAVIAWREGTELKTVTAREGWDPKVGSGLTFHDKSKMQNLEFLRLDENIEVFLNKDTGDEVYIHRSSTPVDSLFTSASKVIKDNFTAAGEPPLTGDAAAKVSEAAGMLERVIAEVPDWWNAQWFYAKSQMALGNHQAAYKALHHAYSLQKTVEAIPRELAGVCLEIGKFDESVKIAEAALALEPSDPELLGNLALSYLLAGRLEAARKALEVAFKINPNDTINQTIDRIITEIDDGRRAMPRSLKALSCPAKPKKRRWLKLPWW